MNGRYLNTVSHWYGRLGNNIQQICNGIIFSSINGDGFFSPHHDLIEQIVIGSQEKTTIRPCRFFHYNTSNKDFDINIDYLYKNISKVAKKYVVPAFKFSVEDPLDDDTLVIHIRSGDIFAHEHNPSHDYVPNPLHYYLTLIQEYEKVIVVTEPDNYNPIIDELKKNDKVDVQSKSVGEDFSTLMRAKNVASSGTGTFAVAAALCSSNIKRFYCTNLYLDEHLNPEMLMATNDIEVHMMELKDYIELKTWKNNQDQRKFILEYKNENI
jgi:hypothetical protein